jgi:hypothetical protein
MPVVAAVMVYAGATSAALGAATWAGLAAGAQLVGGAISLVGTLTGNEKMASAGLMIGAAGSIGAQFAGGAASTTGAATEAGNAATTTGTATLDSASQYGNTMGQMGGQAASSAVQTASGMADITAKLDALEKAQTLNMYGNVAQGVSTAYTGYQQNQTAQDNFDKQRADQQALIDERRRNMNLTGLKLNTPTMPKVQNTGLINRPINQTMMQIQ